MLSSLPAAPEDAASSSPSITILSADLRRSLIPVATLGLISSISTLSLILFLSYRLLIWRQHYHTSPGRNQYFVLIFNLLLADLQQSIAFLLSFAWIARGNIDSSTATCFIQGWLVQVGDVTSGLWVLAIAAHTWYAVIMGRKLKHTHFCSVIVGIWVFSMILAIIGPAVHKGAFFTNTGAWCWIETDYWQYRLGLHYFWMFLSQFGSVLIYVAMFVLLLRKARLVPASSRIEASPISRAARFMVLYPAVYLTLALPLPAARLATWSGREVSLNFYCVAAALMTSCGFIDALLYTLTRRILVNESRSMIRSPTYHMESENRLTGPPSPVKERGPLSPWENSSDEILGLGLGSHVREQWEIEKTVSFDVRVESSLHVSKVLESCDR